MTRSRGLRLLVAAEVLLTAGLALAFPFFALYLSRDRGVPVATVGLLLSATLLLAALSQGLGGEVSDLAGRRKVMAWAMGARTVLTVGLAEGVRRGWPPPALVGLHMAGAFAGNFFGPASRGWIADQCAPDERVRAYGRLRMGTNLGWALGPAAGGFLAERSYAGMFYATAAACAACGLLVALLLADARGPARSDGFSPRAMLRALADRRLREFCAGAFLIGLAMSFLIVPFSVHCARVLALSEAQIGLLFSLNGLLVAASLPWASRALSRRRITEALAGGSALFALGYLLVGAAGGLGVLAAGVVLASLGEVAVSPGLHALGANLAPDALRGRYIGVSSFLHVAGFAAAPGLGGWLLERSAGRPALPWLFVAGVAVLATAVFFRLGRSVGAREQGLAHGGLT